jgi:hypothetical protein
MQFEDRCAPWKIANGAEKYKYLTAKLLLALASRVILAYLLTPL